MQSLKKKCASDEEIEEYFHSNLASLELQVVKPNLKDYHKEPLVKYFVDAEYTAKAIKYYMKGKEFLFKESLVELEDDLIGIIDEPVNLHILEWTKGNEFLKKPSKDPIN